MDKEQLIKKLYDADFQDAFTAQPHEILQEVGIEIPATTEVKVVRNSKDTLNIVMPDSEGNQGLNDDDLGQISAGEALVTLSILIGGTLLIGTIGTVIAGGIAAGYVTGQLGGD